MGRWGAGGIRTMVRESNKGYQAVNPRGAAPVWAEQWKRAGSSSGSSSRPRRVVAAG